MPHKSLVPPLLPCPYHDMHGMESGDSDALALPPASYSFQRNKKLYFNIFTLHGLLAASRVKKPLERTGTAKVEIQPAKQVVEIDPAEQIFLAESLHSRETADIIFSALLRVGQDSIRLGNFLKALLGSWFLVTIWMLFQGKHVECILDCSLSGVFGNSKHLIIISLRRNNCSP